jgi:hypothetical protein
MALSYDKTITVAGRDITFQSAYAKITSVQGSKDRITACVEIRTAADGEPIAYTASTFSHNCESPDGVFRQAYLHLKTLPEFANAVDC